MSGNFAIRLRCPDCETDSWVTLAGREESADQIRKLTWDFKCREHGAQRGAPKEVLEMAPLDEPNPPEGQQSAPALANVISSEKTKRAPRSSDRIHIRIPIVVYGYTKDVGAFHEETETLTVNASGALVMLKTKLELGESIFLMQRSTGQELSVRVVYLDTYSERETKVGLAFKYPLPNFWRRSRKEPRAPKALRVVVKGTDPNGHPFKQRTYTVNLSQDGACLDGVGFLTSPGQIIEVRRLWRSKKYRVVWVGQIGSTESNQVGVMGLQSEKHLWHVALSDEYTAEPPKE
jgi:hypothetical protein